CHGCLSAPGCDLGFLSHPQAPSSPANNSNIADHDEKQYKNDKKSQCFCLEGGGGPTHMPSFASSRDNGHEGHSLADARTAPDWNSEGKERWRDIVKTIVTQRSTTRGGWPQRNYLSPE
ncbi:unnamed protein product, partial [Discosporangium mesarthrocarpum]